jgi:hypothetical protein
MSIDSAATESGWDYISVYDGSSSSASLLYSQSGTFIWRGKSTGSSMYFTFKSDGVVTASGYKVTWSCYSKGFNTDGLCLPGYTSLASCFSFSSEAFSVSVTYINGSAQGCSIPIPCPSSPAYIGSAGACTCAPEYSGSVSYINGSVSGCLPCPSPAYVVKDGTCTCAPEYSGSVSYINGSVSGCFPCPSPAYVVNEGTCTCAPDAIGNISYINGSVSGCFSPCRAPQFAGSPGACTCSPGYATLSNSVSVTYLSGSPQGCSILIPCPAPAYTGSAGACTCAPEYSGIVSYINGSVSGCFAACRAPRFTGLPGACTCSPGYVTSLNYNNTFLKSETFYDR